MHFRVGDEVVFRTQTEMIEDDFIPGSTNEYQAAAHLIPKDGVMVVCDGYTGTNLITVKYRDTYLRLHYKRFKLHKAKRKRTLVKKIC